MIDPEEGVTDRILQRALDDTQKLSQNGDLSIIEKKVIEVQYYLLLFIISDKRKDKAKREYWSKWFDKFQWIIIPMVISGFTIFIWQALYFYFNLAPTLLQQP